MFPSNVTSTAGSWLWDTAPRAPSAWHTSLNISATALSSFCTTASSGLYENQPFSSFWPDMSFINTFWSIRWADSYFITMIRNSSLEQYRSFNFEVLLRPFRPPSLLLDHYGSLMSWILLAICPPIAPLAFSKLSYIYGIINPAVDVPQNAAAVKDEAIMDEEATTEDNSFSDVLAPAYMLHAYHPDNSVDVFAPPGFATKFKLSLRPTLLLDTWLGIGPYRVRCRAICCSSSENEDTKQTQG